MFPKNIFPTGKLKPEILSQLLDKFTTTSHNIIVGPAVGEDAAVISLDDKKLLIATTDPITFVTDAIGYYAVVVNSNDIASMGGTPKWFLATILLPEKISDFEMVENIFSQISSTCKKYNIAFCGGHTEVTHNLSRPIVVGMMMGETEKNKLIRSSGALLDDDIILTKGIPVEGISIIAREKSSELESEPKFDKEFIERCKDFLFTPGISVLKDARIACSIGGVNCMHDPTEGGLATGLREIAAASNVGLKILHNKLPILPEGKKLCEKFALDPLGTIASGALIITASSQFSPLIISALKKENIPATVIGQIMPKNYGIKLLAESNKKTTLPVFEKDEITKIW